MEMMTTLPSIPATPTAYLERITVKAQGQITFVDVTDVDYFEAAANYVRLHIGDDTRVIRGKISELAMRLNPKSFARIHRSTIVNRSRVSAIQPLSSGDALVVLHNGRRIRMSRLYRELTDSNPRVDTARHF
jgi:two-component system, LytTR family, response regulator